MSSENTQNGRQGSEWHLDKKVPVALIIALAVHAFSSIWWAATVSSRVSAIEVMAEERRPYFERVSKVEVEVERNTELLHKIDGKLDRVLENSRDDD